MLQDKEPLPRKGRVLILDDMPTWRNELTRLLQKNGYKAHAVATVQEALATIQKDFYHVLILDINMQTSDSTDSQGLVLLKELAEHGLMEALQVIILSAFGTQERVRQAFREYKVIDFLEKSDIFSGTNKFLESVHTVFALQNNINLNLEIVWPFQITSSRIMRTLHLDDVISSNQEWQDENIGEELEDLFCRLFHDAQSVVVRPLTTGLSGVGVLQAQPFFRSSGKGRAVIVRFGDFRQIAQEYAHFKEHAQSLISQEHNTIVLDQRRTSRLGGVTYSLLGAKNEHLTDFVSFYHSADVFQIKEILNHLFLDTYHTWYANPGRLQVVNLTSNYQPIWENSLREIQKESSPWLKQLKGLENLPAPIQNIEQSPIDFLQKIVAHNFIYPTYICITHGNLIPENLLLDNNGHVWLIDFQETGKHHILSDIATLDSAIRFQVLSTEDADLRERLQMEQTLIGIKRFSHLNQLPAILSSGNQALAKAYATVIHLRTLASKLIEQSPIDNMDEYYTALLYNAISALSSTKLTAGQREHAWLCVNLLAEQLEIT